MNENILYTVFKKKLEVMYFLRLAKKLSWFLPREIKGSWLISWFIGNIV